MLNPTILGINVHTCDVKIAFVIKVSENIFSSRNITSCFNVFKLNFVKVKASSGAKRLLTEW